MLTKVFQAIKRHKLFSVVIIVVLGVVGVFSARAFKSETSETRYVLSQAEKSTISTTITGSGQVSASQQLEIKAKVSGEVASLKIKKGQEVKAKAILVQLNATELYKSIRDAQSNLESAKLSLEKLKKPASELTVMQQQNNLAQAEESKQEAEDDLKKTYDDGFTTVANTFLDLPEIMTGLTNMFFDETIENGHENIDWYANQTVGYSGVSDKAQQYRNDVYKAYKSVQESFTKIFDEYKIASRSSDTETIEKLISETYDTTKLMADTVKTANNYIDFVEDALTDHQINIPTIVSTHQTLLDTYTSETNTHLSSLLNIKNTIKDSKTAIVNADRTIAENTASLVDTTAGTDPLDIRSAELTLKQRQDAVYDAQEKLADYTIRAPFDGVVASIDIQKGDSVSSGGTIATIITKQQVAEISLNEVDVAQVEVGQKVTLTYDALEDLQISGTVAEVDLIGTTNQGVVSYTVTIVFDTQDARIKPGMSVSATIITEIKQDVIVVPVGAVKTQGDVSYVELVEDGAALGAVSISGVALATPPRQQIVEVGISNDTVIEIISGLAVGDYVVSRTITQTAGSGSAQTQSAPSLFGGGTGGARQGFTGAPPSGGNVQILR